MIIGVDIDDTISDTYEVMMNYAQEYIINFLKKEPIIDEKVKCENHFYVSALYNWRIEEENDFLENYFQKILINVKPKTLAVDYLNKLKRDGNKIIIITARARTDLCDVEKLTEDWIYKNNIPCDKLIIDAENKLVVAEKENIDVFIDDSFVNCKMVADNKIKTFIMDTRVNKEFFDENIERVYSWPHLYMKLKEINK